MVYPPISIFQNFLLALPGHMEHTKMEAWVTITSFLMFLLEFTHCQVLFIFLGEDDYFGMFLQGGKG